MEYIFEFYIHKSTGAKLIYYIIRNLIYDNILREDTISLFIKYYLKAKIFMGFHLCDCPLPMPISTHSLIGINYKYPFLHSVVNKFSEQSKDYSKT